MSLVASLMNSAGETCFIACAPLFVRGGSRSVINGPIKLSVNQCANNKLEIANDTDFITRCPSVPVTVTGIITDIDTAAEFRWALEF